MVLSLNDVHSDTRFPQQFEGTCELTLARFPLTVFHLMAIHVVGHIRAFTNHKLSILLSDQMDMGIVIGVQEFLTGSSHIVCTQTICRNFKIRRNLESVLHRFHVTLTQHVFLG